MAGPTDSATKRDFIIQSVMHGSLDSKKSGERLAHQTVLDSAVLPSTVAQSERDTLQTLTTLSQETPEQRKIFEETACHELTYSSLGRSLWFTGARQLSFFQKYEKPDCNDPISRQQMVLNLLDYRFAKPLPIGLFRGPELERMRSLYLTGKETEPETSKYSWDGRIPDFRSGAARGLPLVIIPLILKAPIVGALIAGFGIGSGKVRIESSQVELQNAQNERKKNEATRENQRGKTTVVLSIISLIAGFLRVLNTPAAAPAQETEAPLAEVLRFDPTARTTPLSPPPTDPGEGIISLAAVRAARMAPAGQATSRVTTPTQGYSSNPAILPSVGNPTAQTTTPLSATQGSGVTSQAANASMSAESAASNATNQMENGVLVCIGNTARATVARPQPVEVLPVKPLVTPAQLQDGPMPSSITPLTFVDRDGNHIAHASILNSLSEQASRSAAPLFSTLAAMMSSEVSGGSDKKGKTDNNGDSSPAETDLDRARRKRAQRAVDPKKLAIEQMKQDILGHLETRREWMGHASARQELSALGFGYALNPNDRAYFRYLREAPHEKAIKELAEKVVETEEGVSIITDIDVLLHAEEQNFPTDVLYDRIGELRAQVMTDPLNPLLALELAVAEARYNYHSQLNGYIRGVIEKRKVVTDLEKSLSGSLEQSQVEPSLENLQLAHQLIEATRELAKYSHWIPIEDGFQLGNFLSERAQALYQRVVQETEAYERSKPTPVEDPDRRARNQVNFVLMLIQKLQHDIGILASMGDSPIAQARREALEAQLAAFRLRLDESQDVLGRRRLIEERGVVDPTSFKLPDPPQTDDVVLLVLWIEDATNHLNSLMDSKQLAENFQYALEVLNSDLMLRYGREVGSIPDPYSRGVEIHPQANGNLSITFAGQTIREIWNPTGFAGVRLYTSELQELLQRFIEVLKSKSPKQGDVCEEEPNITPEEEANLGLTIGMLSRALGDQSAFSTEIEMYLFKFTSKPSRVHACYHLLYALAKHAAEMQENIPEYIEILRHIALIGMQEAVSDETSTDPDLWILHRHTEHSEVDEAEWEQWKNAHGIIRHADRDRLTPQQVLQKIIDFSRAQLLRYQTNLFGARQSLSKN